MALRLTADQLLAVAAGQRFLHTWEILSPSYAGDTADNAVMIHSDVLGFPRLVTDPGWREFEAFNTSPAVNKPMNAPRYSIVVDNTSGRFYHTHASSYWCVNPPDYYPNPKECRLRHRVYLTLLDGTVSEITRVKYVGRVLSVPFEDLRNPLGDPIPVSATINTEAVGAWGSLRRQWTADDCNEVDTTVNVTLPAPPT